MTTTRAHCPTCNAWTMHDQEPRADGKMLLTCHVCGTEHVIDLGKTHNIQG
jgi:RNase P subunit RPR2